MVTQAMSTIATGMVGTTDNITNIAHNLANINTVAFSEKAIAFQDLLYLDEKRVGSSVDGNVVPTGIQIGLGSKVASVYQITKQGELMQTGNNLDIAIKGKGYLVLNKPNGDVVYTRAGNLTLGNDGSIQSFQGYKLQPQITIPSNATTVQIGEDGTVSVQEGGSLNWTQLGQIELVTFLNENGLQHLGGNVVAETEASGSPVQGTPGEEGYGAILGGWLEMSGVEPITQMTNMIKAHRAFEMQSKVLQTVDSILQKQASG